MESYPTTPHGIANSPSVLSALARLSPPSPILSPSQISSPWTSGEIPILLGSSTIDSESGPVTGPGFCASRSFESVFDFDSDPPMRTGGATSPMRGRGLGFMGINCAAIGTFVSMHQASPNRGNSIRKARSLDSDCEEVSPSPSGCDFLLSRLLASASVPPSPEPCLQTYHDQHHGATVSDSRFTLSPYLESSGPFPTIFKSAIQNTTGQSDFVPVYGSSTLATDMSLDDAFSPARPFQTYPSPRSYSSWKDVQEEDEFGQVPGCVLSSLTGSTMPSPTFAPSTPSPSTETIVPETLLSNYKLKSRLSRDLQRSATYTDATPASDPNMSKSAPCSPLLPPTQISFTRRRSISNTTECDGTSFVVVPPVLPAPRTRTVPSLPPSLAWLKYITINFLIDQEGFRSVNPPFKLVGYSSIARDGPETDVVEFMPIQRETYPFHYAPLDGPPILRRISVNGNEARDYISREASLILKTNGVYTVRGSESCIVNPTANADGAKLKWKLDYVVQDRRAEATGKIMSGEKTFTPLTFSCSPLLLHPLQGKKVRLIHMVKKNLVPKLVAEKMEPPKQPNVGKGYSAIVAETTTNHLAKARAWGLHRRARSHVPKPPTLVTTRCHGQLGCVENEPTAQQGTPRRRRASSAGEHAREPITVTSGWSHPPSHGHTARNPSKLDSYLARRR